MVKWIVCAASLLLTSLTPVAASAAPPLHLPWSCDDSYAVTNGHDTNTHTGMDRWAWDFGLPAGTEVVAPADGVVRMVKMNSNVGGCNSAYANDANYVVIEFGDGTEALLMHLAHQSSSLSVGQAVKQGDVVGRVGLTGWVCGAHLHFQIQETCGTWWCQSIPASFVGEGDPGEGVPLTSANCPSKEPCAAVLDGTTTVIDDADGSCFERITSWFWPGADGWEDGHVYTWANDAAEPDTMGIWSFDVEVPGDYRLEVFVPDEDATSELATYEVQTGSETLALGPVNQSLDKGWIDLGIVTMQGGEEHWVRLTDNTGEPRSLDRKVAFDAVRFSWEPPTVGDTDGSGTGTTATTGTGEPPPPDPGSTSGSDPVDEDAEPSSSSSGDASGQATPTAGSGCRLGHPGEPDSRWLLLSLLALAAGARRRSATRSRPAC